MQTHEMSAARDRQPDGRVHAIVTLILTVAIGIAAYRSYLSHRNAFLGRIHGELQQIAGLKASEVAAWRLERVGDATVAATDARHMPSVKTILAGRPDTQSKLDTLEW